jgi:hypothetical protein
VRKDPRRSGPAGLSRTPLSDARERRNASISASNRFSADRVAEVNLNEIRVDQSPPQPTSLDGVLKRLYKLESTLNEVIRNLKAVRAMDE